jgi:hypothetical protein
MTFTIVYTGTNAGYRLEGNGTINEDGSVEGEITYGNCQTFTMPEESFVKTTTFDGNHGQWVKMSEDKKAAAQSRVGMPVQSKGHNK